MPPSTIHLLYESSATQPSCGRGLPLGNWHQWNCCYTSPRQRKHTQSTSKVPTEPMRSTVVPTSLTQPGKCMSLFPPLFPYPHVPPFSRVLALGLQTLQRTELDESSQLSSTLLPLRPVEPRQRKSSAVDMSFPRGECVLLKGPVTAGFQTNSPAAETSRAVSAVQRAISLDPDRTAEPLVGVSSPLSKRRGGSGAIGPFCWAWGMAAARKATGHQEDFEKSPWMSFAKGSRFGTLILYPSYT